MKFVTIHGSEEKTEYEAKSSLRLIMATAKQRGYKPVGEVRIKWRRDPNNMWQFLHIAYQTAVKEDE